MNRPLRVGIVGARGIGKHHAKWFALAGCDVTAVYGRTAETANEAAAGLAELMGFQGKAFSDWSAFRREGGFEVCSVCSLMDAHGDQVRDLADDGRDILCEKPLVWRWNWTSSQILAEARAVVDYASQRNVILGVNAQYPAVLEGWAELHRQALGAEPIYEALHFVMETRGKQRTPHGASEAWIDLGPHPLALIDSIAPGGVDWPTLRCDEGPNAAVVDFEWVSGPKRIPVHMECRRGVAGDLKRQVGNQAMIADIDGFNLGGVFQSRLRAHGLEWSGRDFMRVSIERFIEAVTLRDPSKLLVDGAGGARQEEALVGVLDRCWPGIIPASS